MAGTGDIEMNTHPLAARPTYSREQLEAYVKATSPDPSYTLEQLEADIKADPLKTLGLLQLRMLGFVTWGNLALHYSWHRALSLDPQALFHKIVERRHGGYCMENNAFFSTLLRSLGYRLYISGGRISYALSPDGRDPAGFHHFEHEVILVLLNNKKYLVDVGFGSGNPVSPIELVDEPGAEPVVHDTTPSNYVRLVRRAIAPFTDPTQRMWVLETNNDSHPGEWRPAYCFSEVEWLPADFEVINFRTSRDPKSWFTTRLILVKILMDERGEKATGTLMLQGGEVARRLADGKKEVLVEAQSEAERVQAMREWFGIVLREEEERGIQGLVSELKAPSKD